MMKKWILAGAILAGLTAPAFADECTDLIDRVDLALPTAALDQVTKMQVMDYYNQGKAEHDANNHDAAVNALMQALNLLGQ